MSKRIRVVDRVADILACFTLDTPERGVSEISEQLGLDKATVCRILLTLKDRGLVRSDPQTQKYSVGPQVLVLAQVALGRANLRTLGSQYCLSLRDQTGETAALTVREGFQRFCIEQIESRHEVRRTTELGKPLPLHCGASGKVLLAHLPTPDIERFFECTPLVSYTQDTIIDAAVLREQLGQIREQGYAISVGERVAGSVTIAAPVWDHRREAVAALSMAMPAMRYQSERLPEFVAVLQSVAGRLSAELGYFAPPKNSH